MRGFSTKLQQICIPIGMIAILTVFYFNGKKIKSRFLDLDFGNSSYLADTSYFGSYSMLHEFLYGSGAFGSRAAFERLYDEYEMKMHYGLLDHNARQAYHNQFSRISENALMEFQKFHTVGFMKKVGKIESLAELKTPAAVVALIAAAYSGRMVEYKASADLKIKSQSLIQENQIHHQMLGVDTRYLSSSLDYSRSDPSQNTGSDYRAGLFKEFSTSGTRAGAAYSIGAQAVTMNVNQALSSSVSVSYDWCDANTTRAQHTVGVGFTSGF